MIFVHARNANANKVCQSLSLNSWILWVKWVFSSENLGKNTNNNWNILSRWKTIFFQNYFSLLFNKKNWTISNFHHNKSLSKRFVIFVVIKMRHKNQFLCKSIAQSKKFFRENIKKHFKKIHLVLFLRRSIFTFNLTKFYFEL